MSASNWMNNAEIPVDRNNRYRVDNVSLQLHIGLPVELIGAAPIGRRRHFCFNSNGLRSQRPQKYQGEPMSRGIKQTVDGIPIRKVYITNISLEVQWKDLYRIFGRFGEIINVYLSVSKNDSTKKFAFVTFEDPKAAANVLGVQKFQDGYGHNMYVMAADSWHQPPVDSKGNIKKSYFNMNANNKKQEESEDEDQSSFLEEQQLVNLEINEKGLNLLNDDCLLHIFSFFSLKEISRLECVCKRWQGLSNWIWRGIHKLSFKELKASGIKPTPEALTACLQRCGPSLQELDLAVSNHQFDETTVISIAKNCPNLEVLRLLKIVVVDRGLAHLGHSCPKLKTLHMNECSEFNDKDLMSLLPKCNQLTELDISHSDEISGKCLTKLRSPLSCLRLCNTQSLDIRDLIPALEGVSESLNTLVLDSCGIFLSSQVDKIVSVVPNLTSFSMTRCMPGVQMNFSNPLDMIGKLKKLTSLNLTLNRAVDDKVIEAIIDNCKLLTSINLSGSVGAGTRVLSEQGLSKLAYLRRLTHLDISYLENNTDNVLKTITSRNTRLQQLVCRGCHNITEEGCVQVVTMCNDLELFDLSGCDNVGEATVSAALTSVRMRSNNVPLRLILGGTMADEAVNDPEVPMLILDQSDLSDDYLRPEFIDELFFPLSDSDDEDDLDHLCCPDCDVDDLFDPTLFPDDFIDDTKVYGEYDESTDDEHSGTWAHWSGKDNEGDECEVEGWD